MSVGRGCQQGNFLQVPGSIPGVDGPRTPISITRVLDPGPGPTLCVIGPNPLHTIWFIVDIADIIVVQYDVFPASVVIPDGFTAICLVLFSNAILVALLLKPAFLSELRYLLINIMVMKDCLFGKSLVRTHSTGL